MTSCFHRDLLINIGDLDIENNFYKVIKVFIIKKIKEFTFF